MEKVSNSLWNGVSFQCDNSEKTDQPVLDSELLIELLSDDYSEIDDHKKSSLPYAYSLEQDIEKLINLSKEFQKEYENENENGNKDVAHDAYQNIYFERLTPNSDILIKKSDSNQSQECVDNIVHYYFSNSSSSYKEKNILDIKSSQITKKKFQAKIPNIGPFGTGIIRPEPRKHSCVNKNEVATMRSYPSGNTRKPYTSRYYNYNKTHPNFELIETNIPKRIIKRPCRIKDKEAISYKGHKPILDWDRGVTWHDLFDRGNIYSAKSFQSSSGFRPVYSKCTQTSFSESSFSNLNKNLIQKHILPQMNIPAECCVQAIPIISIAPTEMQRQLRSNIKLVEIIYKESETNVEDIQTKEGKSDASAQELSARNAVSSPAVVSEVNKETQTSAFNISSATSPNTSLNREYDSSLEESISLDLSRMSPTDPEAVNRLVPNNSSVPQKFKRLVKHRSDIIDQRLNKSSSEPSEFEFDGIDANDREAAMMNMKLPIFPTANLIQMVDEIFDTSSDGWTGPNPIKVNCKQVVKEISVQTDIVWENVNEFLRKQRVNIDQPLHNITDNNLVDLIVPTECLISNGPRDNMDLNSGALDRFKETNRNTNTMPLGRCFYQPCFLTNENTTDKDHCPHTPIKNFKVCSCLECKNRIRFSASEIHRCTQPNTLPNSSPSDSSSDTATVNKNGISKPRLPDRTHLLPSERYKQMKQAQREHFENDPRISKTLKRIYKAAKTIKTQGDATTSSSSNHNNFTRSRFFDDEALQPDLFTFTDELLLFGPYSSNEYQYSSYLLKTESSQTTTTTNETFYGGTTNKKGFLPNKLTCTNSEDSSGYSYNEKARLDLEQHLLNDIENSWSDPAALVSVFSTSSLERKMNEISNEESKLQ